MHQKPPLGISLSSLCNRIVSQHEQQGLCSFRIDPDRASVSYVEVSRQVVERKMFERRSPHAQVGSGIR